MQEKLSSLEARLVTLTTELENALDLARRNREIELSAEELTAQVGESKVQIDSLNLQLEQLKAKESFTENQLRQREEETHQYLQEIDALKSELESAGQLRKKLADADAWVFRLAGERAGYQLRISQLEALSVRLTSNSLDKDKDIARLREDLIRQTELVVKIKQEATRLEQQMAARASDPPQLTSEVRALQDQLARRFKEIAQLSQDVLDKDNDNTRLRLEHQRHLEKLHTLEQENRNLHSNLARRFTEIAQLTEIIIDKDNKLVDLDWLRKVHGKLARTPAWWFLLPARWRRKREHGRLMRANLFDAEAYLQRYPDVAEEGLDPVLHYILHGMTEARTRDLA